MKNIAFNTDKEGYFEGRIVLQIADLESLELLVEKIKSVEGVADVVRID
jgi:(p)ppGpp synthase/HD superfamily hydrolase